MMSNVNEIPNGWVETTLGAIMEISSGKTRPKIEGEIPIYGGNGIMGYGNKSNQEQPSIIVGRVGAYCGAVYLEKKPFWLSDNALGVRNNLDSDLMFLYYKLISMRLNNHAIGGAQPLVTQTLLKELEILIPKNINEQKAIANILTAFDDKIENLEAQNNTLEQTAQTIFAAWFGKYQVGDELPDGWRVGKLGDYISDSIGGDYGKEEPQGDYEIETICLRGTDLPDMKMGVPEKAPVRFLKKSKIEKCKLLNGDIVIEISGGTENQSTGRVAYINQQILNQSNSPMTCVNFCRILRPKNPENSYFIYSLFEYLYNRRILFNWENGTTGIKNLNLKALLEVFELVLPDNEDLIKKFNSISKSSFGKIQTNNIQIQTLKQTRDTLLPKLMSGQLRVNEFKS